MRLNRDILLAIIVVVMIIAVGLLTPAFVSPDNLVGLFNDTAILIMMALAQMTVILTKCIDLSVAANVAFTGVVVALINAAYPGLPIPLLMRRRGRHRARCSAPSTARWSGSSASPRSS